MMKGILQTAATVAGTLFALTLAPNNIRAMLGLPPITKPVA